MLLSLAISSLNASQWQRSKKSLRSRAKSSSFCFSFSTSSTFNFASSLRASVFPLASAAMPSLASLSFFFSRAKFFFTLTNSSSTFSKFDFSFFSWAEIFWTSDFCFFKSSFSSSFFPCKIFISAICCSFTSHNIFCNSFSKSLVKFSCSSLITCISLCRVFFSFVCSERRSSIFLFNVLISSSNLAFFPLMKSLSVRNKVHSSSNASQREHWLSSTQNENK